MLSVWSMRKCIKLRIERCRLFVPKIFSWRMVHVNQLRRVLMIRVGRSLSIALSLWCLAHSNKVSTLAYHSHGVMRQCLKRFRKLCQWQTTWFRCEGKKADGRRI